MFHLCSDIGSEINTVFFKRNGGCGYILKPEILRMKNRQVKDKEVLAAPVKFALQISVRILLSLHVEAD